MPAKNRYVALLRGINVGGNKKVPMADLRELMESIGFTEIETLLNSGNAIFTASSNDASALSQEIADAISDKFRFSVPTLVYPGADILSLVRSEPFKGVNVHKDIRLYVTFCPKPFEFRKDLPWTDDKGSFTIISERHKTVMSVLDLSKTGTVEGMKMIERTYGDDVTTRNWNTVLKISSRI